MIVAHMPVPGLGIITNWDFSAQPVTPLGEARLHALSWDQPASAAPELEGISDVFAAFEASGWAYKNRKWLVGGGVALMAFGAFKLLF